MSGLRNGRAQKALRHIAEKGRATMRGVIIAIEPGCKPANMSGTLFSLVYAGKLITKRIDDLTWFYPTADAKGKPRGPRKPREAKPATPSKPRRSPAKAPRARTDPAAKAQAAAELRARRMPGGLVLQPSPLRTPARAPTAEPETVEAFLARGGKVQRLPIGETAHPFTHIGHAAINKATWRARQRAADKAA